MLLVVSLRRYTRLFYVTLLTRLKERLRRYVDAAFALRVVAFALYALPFALYALPFAANAYPLSAFDLEEALVQAGEEGLHPRPLPHLALRYYLPVRLPAVHSHRRLARAEPTVPPTALPLVHRKPADRRSF
jgi:hypothetical protein